MDKDIELLITKKAFELATGDTMKFRNIAPTDNNYERIMKYYMSQAKIELMRRGVLENRTELKIKEETPNEKL
jgi:hypothetical protein